jgi:hypothetical protein
MGKKTLEKMLDESTAESGAAGTARRLATFLAYWEEMEEAYRKGWSWLQIYTALHKEGIVDYSYQTFMHYKDKRRNREQAMAKKDQRARHVTDAKPAPVERPSRPPGSGKSELPVFKDVTRDHGDRRF